MLVDVTTAAKPQDLERLGIVEVMAINSAKHTASLASVRLHDLAIANGVAENNVRGALFRIAPDVRAREALHDLWMGFLVDCSSGDAVR